MDNLKKSTFSKSISGKFLNEKKIIIDGNGPFPKKIIIIDNREKREYALIKTRNGKYLLN